MTRLDAIKAAIAPTLARVDALSRRERLLVLITMLTVIAGLWQMLLMEPLGHRADRSRIELESLRERIDSANSNLEEQILQLVVAGNDERNRIAMIQQRIADINSSLNDYASELIDPSEMAEVLEEILREQTRLTLVSIRNKAPEKLAAGMEDAETLFFRHGLEIEVEGNYADCVAYLSEIEALPWRLYWQLLDLEVIEYPRNRIRIEVSTLSLNEEWIGA